MDKPEVLPANWTMKENPSYRYYTYYIWANVRALNHLRASRGLNTLTVRATRATIAAFAFPAAIDFRWQLSAHAAGG